MRRCEVKAGCTTEVLLEVCALNPARVSISVQFFAGVTIASGMRNEAARVHATFREARLA